MACQLHPGETARWHISSNLSKQLDGLREEALQLGKQELILDGARGLDLARALKRGLYSYDLGTSR